MGLFKKSILKKKFFCRTIYLELLYCFYKHRIHLEICVKYNVEKARNSDMESVIWHSTMKCIAFVGKIIMVMILASGKYDSEQVKGILTNMIEIV